MSRQFFLKTNVTGVIYKLHYKTPRVIFRNVLVIVNNSSSDGFLTFSYRNRWSYPVKTFSFVVEGWRLSNDRISIRLSLLVVKERLLIKTTHNQLPVASHSDTRHCNNWICYSAYNMLSFVTHRLSVYRETVFSKNREFCGHWLSMKINM